MFVLDTIVATETNAGTNNGNWENSREKIKLLSENWMKSLRSRGINKGWSGSRNHTYLYLAYAYYVYGNKKVIFNIFTLIFIIHLRALSVEVK